jgi:hypothetical protein
VAVVAIRQRSGLAVEDIPADGESGSAALSARQARL